MTSEPLHTTCRVVDASADESGMANDELEQMLCEPLDELDRELDEMAQALLVRDDRSTPEEPRRGSRFRRSTVEDGYLMAILSHFSVVFGIPVFVATLWMRDNEFSLHHARAAGAIYVLSLLFFVLAIVNCAVFLPLVFLCYIPALIGVYRAAAGVEAGSSAFEPAGERLFGWIEVKQ